MCQSCPSLLGFSTCLPVDYQSFSRFQCYSPVWSSLQFSSTTSVSLRNTSYAYSTSPMFTHLLFSCCYCSYFDPLSVLCNILQSQCSWAQAIRWLCFHASCPSLDWLYSTRLESSKSALLTFLGVAHWFGHDPSVWGCWAFSVRKQALYRLGEQSLIIDH